MAKARKTTTKNCLYCNREFNPALSEVKRGNGKFCTLSCVCHYRNIHYLKPRSVKLEINVCNFCHKKFQHRPYKGLGKFCSLICKNSSKRGPNPGSPNQNIRRRLRNTAFSIFGESCEVCNYSVSVDVHHLIPRFENGSDEPNNLSVLCPNHHREVHNGILNKQDILRFRETLVEMPRSNSGPRKAS